ncbi:TSPAN33 (predicted) [Pycnogonum litorale]
MCFSNFYIQSTFNVKWLKYLIFFANILFWFTGIMVVGTGLHIYVDRTVPVSDYVQIRADPSLMLIVCGCLLFFVTTAGCIGTLRENTFILKMYTYCMLVLLTFFTMIGSLAFLVFYSVGHSNVIMAEDDIKASLRYYKENKYNYDYMNRVQLKLRCCGFSVEGYRDWSVYNKYFNCSTENKSPERCSVPYSCCKLSKDRPINKMCGYNTTGKQVKDVEHIIYTTGCVQILKEVLKKNSIIVGVTSLGVTIPMFCATTLVIVLTTNVRKHRKSYISSGIMSD